MTANETHEGAENVIEPAVEFRVDLRQVTEGNGNLKAGEHLTKRAEGVVVASCAILSSTIAALGYVQRRTGQRLSTLPSEIRVTAFELFDKRSDGANKIQKHGIDTKHGCLLC